MLEKIEKIKGGLFYSVVIIVGYLFASVVATVDFGSAVLNAVIKNCVQPAFFVVTALVFTKISKKGVRSSLGLKKFAPEYLTYALLLFVGLFFGFGYLNDLFAGFLSSVGVNVGWSDFAVNGVGEYFAYLFSLSVAPAFGEEFLFRGLLLFILIENYDDYGDLFTSVFVALLFAVFHKNVAQFFYQFVYGFSMTLITLKSKSVFPAVIMHGLNNFVVLTVVFISPEANVYRWYLCVLGILAWVYATYKLLAGRKKGSAKFGFFSIGASVGVLFCVLIAFISNFGGLLS
ncbi:MAG: CPBP family intramembrane metalloprotease [Clostridia bacterium]|nr:CPBP family intramembrane metalloprotease [Clostridia bacterium]